MDKQAVIRSIVEDCLMSQALDLVDLIYRDEGRGLVLRLLVDRPEGGITIEECARINREVSRILDEKAILARYLLEVSSPGLDRPLETKADFLRCINRQAMFFLNEEIEGRLQLEGSIAKAEEDAVYINTGENKIVKIPLLKIVKAKQVIR